MPSSVTGGIHERVSSPPGDSTLITFAPRSASSIAQYGPARTREKSATSSPESGPGRAGSVTESFPSYCPHIGHLSVCRLSWHQEPLSRRLTGRRKPATSGTTDGHRNLRGTLCRGPVRADRARRLDQQRKVLADQHVERRLRSVGVDVERGDHLAVTVAQRDRDRPDAGGELLVGQRPAAGPHLAQGGGAVRRVRSPWRGDA